MPPSEPERDPGELMPNSMTGFGRGEASGAHCTATVEVRAVNNRYLNIKMKLPQRYHRFEASFEEQVRRLVNRGSVELFLRIKSSSVGGTPVVDAGLVARYVASIQEMARQTSLPADLDLGTVLSLPGVITLDDDQSVAPEEQRAVRSAMKQALGELTASRSGEGERLAVELSGLLDRAEKTAAAIERRAPRVPAQQKKRLLERIDRLMKGSSVELDRGQLEKEVSLLADRSDITEELARLKSHAEGFRKALEKKGSIGRSLDFLIQELAREANTIGSKNQDVSIGRRVVELKAWIERLREQVQNIE